MRTACKVLILPALTLIAVAAPAAGQQKRGMTAVDMIEVPQLTDPRLSPDAGQVLFVLGKADWKANRRITHIWRVNVDGSGLTQMTNGPKGESSPRWSPDGTSFAFLRSRPPAQSDAEEVHQIHLISNSGGEAVQLTSHDTAVSRIQWAPDGRALYFLAADPKTKEEKEREKLKDDIYALDEDFSQTHLWKVSIADRKEDRITGGDYSVTDFDISRDGTRIALTRTPTPLFGDSDQGEIYIMDASGGNQIRLTDNRVAEGNLSIAPDNSQVLFTAEANERFETYHNGHLFLVPATGGAARPALADLPYDVESAGWSEDGKSIFLLSNMGVHSQLQQLGPGAKSLKQLTSGGHAVSSWSISRAHHVFLLGVPQNPGEVHILAPGSTAPAKVTGIYDYLGRDFRLPRVEKVQWKGEDGVTVEGVLTYPVDYEPGKRYPLVVNTHGGPRASDKLTFGSWSQYRPVLAARGYAVLQPNYRGSTGYGETFLRDMVGHYFNQSHRDVMAGVDYLVEQGIADPNRLVKMGWSAGGHMTNKIITHTDRFKAASSGAGASNWVSMYAQSDVRSYRTPWFGGTPWQKDAPISVYWDSSPLKDVWKVKTPTIFLVGEKDARVPMPQSVEMHRALKSHGVPTRLYIAPREPHGFGELRHQLFKINVELEWFEKYALGRAYTRAQVPEPASPSR